MQTRHKGANRSPTALSRRNHAIGHGVQTCYVALSPRASVAKTKFASTRRTCPTSRRKFGFVGATTRRLVPERSQNSLSAIFVPNKKQKSAEENLCRSLFYFLPRETSILRVSPGLAGTMLRSQQTGSPFTVIAITSLPSPLPVK